MQMPTLTERGVGCAVPRPSGDRQLWDARGGVPVAGRVLLVLRKGGCGLRVSQRGGEGGCSVVKCGWLRWEGDTGGLGIDGMLGGWWRWQAMGGS